MKTINAYFTSYEELSGFIEENKIKDSKNLLIQIFTADTNFSAISQLTDFFSQNFPLSSLLGATTDGEIYNGKVSTNKTVISFTLFEHTMLQTYICDDFENYFHAGEKLASSLIQEDTKVIISFIDGLSGNGEDYLKGINNIDKNVIVAGGLAGDNAMFEKTYVFTKEDIFSNGIVGVSLSSSSLQVFTDYSFDWQAVGKQLTITKAEKNRVYTIDDKTAVDTYAYYLGEDISVQLPKIGIEFPLIIEKSDLHVARAPIAKEDDGSLIFAGNLNTNDKVRFGCANYDSILHETQGHIDKLRDVEVQSIFIYSCMARRRFMPDEIEHETILYNNIAPTSGFYTNGEFFTSLDNKELLNQSMTILALCESTTSNNRKKIPINHVKHNNTTLQALSHLINISTKELDTLQNELHLLSITDPLTKLYNRRHFTELSDIIFKLAKRHKESLSIIMIDIDYFKKVNDTYGHQVGDQVLVIFSQILEKSKRESDLCCRYGGEEFVILLPKTDLNGAKLVAESIREATEKNKINLEDGQIIKFTVSIGLSIVDLSKEEHIEIGLNRADEALYIAKANGRNQVAYLL